MANAETIILGVLNLTPDSFSDGSKVTDLAAATERARTMLQHGADLIDIGGESTRPGATLVGAEEEQRRVLPVIRELAALGVPMSIDTLHASTAEVAVRAGVRTINDVSGGLFDPAMLPTVARLSQDIDVRYLIGHWRGIPDPSHARSTYDDVVTDVAQALRSRAAAAMDAGVPRESIILDPGLGFDKTATQCWEILRRIDELQAVGFPVCVGVSRKRMLADIVRDTTGTAGTFADRDLATAVVSALAARARVWGVRVHDVLGTAQALAVVRNWPEEGPRRGGSALEPSASRRPDRITLTGLEVYAHHGVFDFEREQGQTFLIDVDVEVDASSAAREDALDRTIHYGDLAERVVRAAERDPVDLIETLAERIAAVVLEDPRARAVSVTVHKPDAPIDAVVHDVSVTIERVRR